MSLTRGELYPRDFTLAIGLFRKEQNRTFGGFPHRDPAKRRAPGNVASRRRPSPAATSRSIQLRENVFRAYSQPG